MRKRAIERKRIIVLGFEGKNNKTESNYFSHFKPVSDKYIIKPFSCGVTDPIGMIKSAKAKRKDYDYNSKEDLTFLFIDCDCDENKKELIKQLQLKQGKDFFIIQSNPCFELWFLNHFCCSTKEYKNNDELIKDLCKYLQDYEKNKDYYLILKDKTNKAIINSRNQIEDDNCKSFTEVYSIIHKHITFKDWESW